MADKFPEYKQAVDDFLSMNPQPGTIIDTEWIDKHLGIDKSQAKDWHSANRVNLQRLTRFEEFRSELLIEHRIYIENVRGKGYVVVPPGQQTERVAVRLMDEIRLAARRANAGIVNIDLEKLTDAEVKENTDMRAKLAALKTGFRRVMRGDPGAFSGKSPTPKMIG